MITDIGIIETTFKSLYNNYSGLMLHIAYGILKDRHLAEDAVQEAFIRINENIYKICDPNCNETRAFVVIIVKNIALNMLKKEKKNNHVDIDDYGYMIGSGEPSVEDRVLGAEDFNTINDGLQCLDGKYKYPIILRYYYGYTDRETGGLLGLDAQTVRMRCFRGRKMLIKILDEGGQRYGQKGIK